jgi:hypothetical protein
MKWYEHEAKRLVNKSRTVVTKEECFNKIMQGQTGQIVTRKDLEFVWQSAQQTEGAK